MEKKYKKSPKFKELLDELGLGDFEDVAPSSAFITEVSGIPTSWNFITRCRAKPQWARTIILGAVANHYNLTKAEIDIILAYRKADK